MTEYSKQYQDEAWKAFEASGEINWKSFYAGWKARDELTVRAALQGLADDERQPKEDKMSIEELDVIADRVEMYFAQQIMELDNANTAYVVEQMISKFELHSARLEAGTRENAQ